MATIALVDDDENILASLKIFFEAEGYNVRTYTDGAAALAALAENPPDLAILDIKMPRMDGVEVLKRLRQSSNLPVIFLNSKNDEMDEVVGFNVGADDYIKKPFSQRLLNERVKAILRRARAGAPGAEQGDKKPIVRGELVLDLNRHARSPAPRMHVGRAVGGADRHGISHPSCAGPASGLREKPRPADGCGL